MANRQRACYTPCFEILNDADSDDDDDDVYDEENEEDLSLNENLALEDIRRFIWEYFVQETESRSRSRCRSRSRSRAIPRAQVE